jgi:hypothetical protein
MPIRQEMILFTVSPATAEATISAMKGSTLYRKSAHGRGLALLFDKSTRQHAKWMWECMCC